MEYVEKAFRTAVTAVLSRDVTVSVADGTPSKARRVGCLGSGRLCGPETGLEWAMGLQPSEDQVATAFDALTRRRRDAERRLRAVMPFPMRTADPLKLRPAIEEAKRAGVDEAQIEAAEARLRAALDPLERAYKPLYAESMLEYSAGRCACPRCELTFWLSSDDRMDQFISECHATAAKAALDADLRAKAIARASTERAAKRSAAEKRLRAAMPYPLQSADPGRLRPVIEDARRAGVPDMLIAAASSKLQAAVDALERKYKPLMDKFRGEAREAARVVEHEAAYREMMGQFIAECREAASKAESRQRCLIS
jgi:hypothetical protein